MVAHISDRGIGLLLIEAILTPLAVFSTVIRVGTRVLNTHTGWDDVVISAATV